MKLPKELFCKVETDPRGVDEPWLSADVSLDLVMGEDTAPTDIGVYRLVEVTRVSRRIVVVKQARARAKEQG